MKHKARNWLAALILVGLLAFPSDPAFADMVITYKNNVPDYGILTLTVSYGPVFNNHTLNNSVILSRVNNDGSRTGVMTQVGVDPADPTHRTLKVQTTPMEGGGAIYELRIKPGAISAQPYNPFPEAPRQQRRHW